MDLRQINKQIKKRKEVNNQLYAATLADISDKKSFKVFGVFLR